MKILIIGGNRFFGKKLTKNLLSLGHEVALLNRGNLDDGFSNRVERILCDRDDHEALKRTLNRRSWDLIYDQVCFDAHQARSAIEIFRDRTSYYIFTSSQSVYDLGSHIKEEAFDPLNYEFTEIVDKDQNYAEAKRQCEATFFKNKSLPVTAVRFPIVAGADDYTKRFQFHIEKIRNHEPIYFPNINAKISLISSDDAASVLSFLATQKIQGPINAASYKPIVLKDLVSLIEKELEIPANLAIDQNPKAEPSPYGIKNDWFMNVEKLKLLGYTAEPIHEWLPREVAAVRG